MKNYTTLPEKYQTLQYRQSTENFRNIVKETYPALDPDSWVLLTRLLYPKREPDTNNIIVDGIPELLLKKFSQEVQALEWSGYNYTTNQARVTLEPNWPDHIKEAIQSERTKLFDQDKVYFITGNRVTPYRQYAMMNEIKRTIPMLTDMPQSQTWLTYMNTLPSNSFSKLIKENGPRTLEKIFSLEEDQEHQWHVFSGIVDTIYQSYKPAEHSVRLVPGSEHHIGLLKREVRRELTNGWHEMDLKHSQLAIGAKLWNVPSVEQFLRKGGNMWNLIMSVTGETDKDLIKRCVYGLMYGAGKKTLEGRLRENYQKFAGISFIQDLFAARQVRLKQIEKDNGALNCYGQFLSVSELTKTMPLFKAKLSILAQLSQAVEMKLLDPVLELAMQNKDDHGFTIMLYQYDGLSIAVSEPSRVEYWKNKISIAVKKQANALGVFTGVEWK
ncbi:MAG: hypothetical protein AAB492_03075 [Patescibacteria group bacterium]